MDWDGNAKSIYACHGASNHSEGERQEEDYYATNPKAIDDLLDREDFFVDIWENARGEDHLANALRKRGHTVRSSDIIKRLPTTEVVDFLKFEGSWHGDIITNPPYKYAEEWVYKSLHVINNGAKLAMFLKLTFLESKSRKEMFLKHPPKVVYVYSNRQDCAKNGDFTGKESKAVAYAWFVWEKGFKGEPIIRWI